MFCSKCGKEFSDGRFCPFCGTAAEENSVPQADASAESAANGGFYPDGGNNLKQEYPGSRIALKRRLAVSNSRLLALSGLILITSALVFDVFSNLWKYIPFDFELKHELFNTGAFLITFAVLFGLSKAPAIKKAFSYREKPDYFLYTVWTALLFIEIFVITGNMLINEILLNKFISQPISIWLEDICAALFLLVSFALLCRRRSGTTVLLSAVSAVIYFIATHWNFIILASLKVDFILASCYTALGRSDAGTYIIKAVFRTIVFLLPVVLALCSIVIKLFAKGRQINTVIAVFCALTVIFKLIECIIDADLDIIGDTVLISGIFIMMMSLTGVSAEAPQTEPRTAVKYTKPAVIGLLGGAGLLLAAAAASGIVSAVYISNHVYDWEEKLLYPDMPESEWSELDSEISRVRTTPFTKLFISSDQRDTYDTISENFSAFKTIALCYNRICRENKPLDENLQQDCRNISSRVDDSWWGKKIFGLYYQRYEEIKPSGEKISIFHSYADGEIQLTIQNNNYIPIYNCVLEVDFEFMYIKPESYSSLDFYRGSETAEVDSVAANGTETVTIEIDPDDYYESYGSYFYASMRDSRVKLVSYN